MTTSTRNGWKKIIAAKILLGDSRQIPLIVRRRFLDCNFLAQESCLQ
jgi:hypothetical protein